MLDGIRLLRAVGVRLPDFSLETASRHILGEGKTFHAADHAAEIQRAFERDPERFVRYNLTDARLAFDILEKLKLVPFTVQRSLLTGMPPDRAGASIAAFDFLYLSRLRERGVVAPTVGVTQGENGTEARQGQQGGHVLPSQPGLHRNVMVFDFRSLYPSIIRTFQIDPLGLIREPVPDGKEGEVIRAPNGACFRRERGILTELLDGLFESRARAREAGDAVAGNAIKLLMNSFYGVLGTPSCRFHDHRLANAITGFGQHFLLWAKEWMERRGLPVLYGDTDSLFVAADEDDAAAQGRAAGGGVDRGPGSLHRGDLARAERTADGVRDPVRAPVPASPALRRARCHQAVRGPGRRPVALHRHGGRAQRLDGARPRGPARALRPPVRRRSGRRLPAAGDRRGVSGKARPAARLPQGAPQGGRASTGRFRRTWSPRASAAPPPRESCAA